jgi:hypothetical protein
MRKIIILFIIFLFLLSSVPFGFTGRNVDKWAVIVSVGKYPWTRERLFSTFNARTMRQILTNKYHFPKQHIMFLSNAESTRSGVFSAINWMKENEGVNSTVVFFFAGHGGRGSMGLYDYTIRDYELATAFSDLDSRKVFMYFISCYSGEFLDDLSGKGRIIVSSTSRTGVTPDLKRRRFLDCFLKNNDADLNGDGLSIEEAYNYSYHGLDKISDNYDGEMFL